MSIAAFDTHAAVMALREAGFDERQAEGVVATVRDAVVEGVATRADVGRLEDKMATGSDLAEVKADVAEMKADLVEVKADVAVVKADLVEVKADVAVVKADLVEVKADVVRLEGRIERVEDKMATKADLAEVKADVAEVKADVARLETRVTVRMYGGLLAAVAAIVALLKLLP